MTVVSDFASLLRQRTPWAVAALLALALLALMLLQLAASREQAGQVEAVLSQLRAELSQPLAGDQQQLLRERVRGLLARRELGLDWVAVSDAAGIVLISAGRHESLSSSLLPDALVGAWRRWLYRMGGDVGRIALEHAGRVVGHCDYALDLPDATVPDTRARLLRVSGVLALLLSALGAALLLWPAFRTSGPVSLTPPASARLRPTESAENDSLGVQLSSAGLGLFIADRDGMLVSLNAAAESQCGWSAAEAVGRPLHSVFHCLDEMGRPLNSAAERCLQESATIAPTSATLRARTGTRRMIEMRAVPHRLASGSDGALMIVADAESRRQEVSGLRRQSQLSQAVIDSLDEGLLTSDRAGVIHSANARALRLFGYGREDIEGSTISKLLPVPFLNQPEVRLSDYMPDAASQSPPPRVVAWRKDATTFPAELEVQAMDTADGAGLVLIVRDVSERVRNANLAQRMGRLLDAAAEEIYVFDAETLRYVEVSRGARRSLGLTAAEFAQRRPSDISPDLDEATLRRHLAGLRSGKSGELVTLRCRHRRADGSDYPVELRLSYSGDEQPPVFMAIASDISLRVEAEEQLSALAHQDALTGLPNRRLLATRITEAIAQANRRGGMAAVLFVDLDHFKQINDRLGHEAGDWVLRAVAQRLLGALHSSDVVVRLGGDEFAILAFEVHAEEDAARIAEKLIQRMHDPVPTTSAPVQAGISIGVAVYPAHGADAETLLRNADRAMYQAKQAGRACYRVFGS